MRMKRNAFQFHSFLSDSKSTIVEVIACTDGRYNPIFSKYSYCPDEKIERN